MEASAHRFQFHLSLSWIIEAWFSDELKTGNFGGPQIQEFPVAMLFGGRFFTVLLGLASSVGLCSSFDG